MYPGGNVEELERLINIARSVLVETYSAGPTYVMGSTGMVKMYTLNQESKLAKKWLLRKAIKMVETDFPGMINGLALLEVIQKMEEEFDK